MSLLIVAGASAASISSITITPGTVTGSVNATGRVTLSAPAGAGGEKVTLDPAPNAVSVPKKVTVPQGQTSVTFSIMTTPVNNQKVVTITGTAVDLTTASATITVNPPSLNGMGFSPFDITGVYGTSLGTVVLNAPAPSNGAKVDLSRSDTKAVIPNSVTVPAGQIYGFFDISAKQVPSTTVVTITATTGTSTASNTLTIEHCVQGQGSPAVGFNATDIVWIDDNLPAGMSLGGAHWNNTHFASGTRSLTLPSSNTYQQYQLTGATTPFPVYDSEVLFAYVLPSICSPTQEIMLGWHTTGGVWKKAYFGSAVIGGEGSAFYGGPAPVAESWNGLRVSANDLGLNGTTIDGFSVETSDGKVYTDHIGKTCAQPFVTPPVIPAGDTYWIDDTEPAPARGIQFTTAQHASGTQSLYDSYTSQWVDTPFSIFIGEKLVAYALTDYCSSPQEMRITWQTTYGEMGGVYWGATQPADAGLLFMGPVPAAGAWARLEVPASLVNLEERQLVTISLQHTGGAMWWDAIGKGGPGCVVNIAAQPSIPAGDSVILDDTPGGAPWGSDTDANTWDFNQKASGLQSWTIVYSPAPAYHNLHVTGLPAMPITSGDNLIAYVLLDPCSTPNEVAITWNGTHGAYWGTANGWESGYTYMGPIPGTPGNWQRLEVPANAVNMQGQSLTALQFNWQNGVAWWDHAGKAPVTSCPMATVAPPSFSAGDSAILEDTPAGAPWGSDTDSSTFVFDQHASGIQSFTIGAYPTAPAYHNLHVTGLPPMAIASGDKLIAYVLLDNCNPASEVAVTWNGSQGAYWGTPHGWESGYANMGPIPGAPGTWIRLEVPATTVNMQGQSLTAVQFNWQDGQAWWDFAGKNTP
jgi:hypothetical protein